MHISLPFCAMTITYFLRCVKLRMHFQHMCLLRPGIRNLAPSVHKDKLTQQRKTKPKPNTVASVWEAKKNPV